MEVTIKAFLQKADASVELRRFALNVESKTTFSGAFKALEAKLRQCFPDVGKMNFTLSWKDSDEDYIVMSSDEELMEAANQSKSSPLKVYITVDDVERQEMPWNDDDYFTVLGNESVAAAAEEVPVNEKEGKEENEDTGKTPANDSGKEFEVDDVVFMGETPSCPPPPFPGFGFSPAVGAPFPPHPIYEEMPPPPPPPPFHHPMAPLRPAFKPMFKGGHGSFAFRACRGGLGGPGGRGGMPRSWFRQERGPTFMARQAAMHDAMSFFGFGPIPFESVHPFQDGYGRRSGDGDGCEKTAKGGAFKRGEEWKRNLREMVPVEHRRWAKSYIREWRSNHLTNATTTTSGEENGEKQGQDGGSSQSAENIPDVYAKWLDRMLPKWHRRWATEKPQEEEEKEFDFAKKSESEKIKGSVPWEFRKWVKWYLKRHFAPKNAPDFKGCHDKKYPDDSTTQVFGPSWNMKKQWKQGRKMLKKSIPLSNRRWVKSFVRQWRLERNLDVDGEEKNSSSSDSDTTEAEKASKGETTIPEDYQQWLSMFLSKWHALRGLITIPLSEANKKLGEMFRATVPMNFRKWVHIFMHRRYEPVAWKKHGHGRRGPHWGHGGHHHGHGHAHFHGHHGHGHHHGPRFHHQGEPFVEAHVFPTMAAERGFQSTEDGNLSAADMEKFWKMLKVFQKQWVKEQQEGTSSASEGDLGITTDSDDDIEDDVVLIDDKKVTSSFKRLRLEDEAGEKVSGASNKELRFEDDEMAGKRGNRHATAGMKFPKEYRRLARDVLWQWDGKTLLEDDSEISGQNGEASAENGDEQLPPYVYNLMAKIVMKRQKKLMKQEMKEAKRMMKKNLKKAYRHH